jgi:prolipoprotein diacylglyceryltransferase
MVEFVRINPRIAFGLSEAQMISLVMITIGLTLWYVSAQRRSTVEAPKAMRA